MANKKFENRQKGIILLFEILFIYQTACLIVALLLKLAFMAHIATVDTYTSAEIYGYLEAALLAFCVARLARNGDFVAGVIGIIIGIISLIFGGILWQPIGALLLVDSILYLVNYKKK